MAKADALKDPLGQHVRVHYRLMDSHAWRALSPTARALWLDLARQAGATRNGLCGTHLKDSQGDRTGLHGRGWTSHHTVLRAARELECLGFIFREVQGGKAGGGKTPTRWSLTHLDVYDNPHKGVHAHTATHAYQRWQSVEQARQAVADMEATLLAQKKSKGQKLPPVAADSALSEANLGAETAKVQQPKGQKLPLAEPGKTTRGASKHADSRPVLDADPYLMSTMADSAHPNSYAMSRRQYRPAFITGKPQTAHAGAAGWRH